MQRKSLLIGLVFFFIAGCTQVTSLNMTKHQFGQQPTKIIWFQVAGLEDEHLAFLRFGFPTVDTKSNMENMICVGKFWNFNLYHLRPSAQESFLSQVIGKKDVRNTCEDFRQRPIWKWIAPKGYKTGILELNANDNESLLRSKTCKEDIEKNFLDEVIFWSMGKEVADSISYSLAAPQKFEAGKSYWDQGCRQGTCSAGVTLAAHTLYEQFAKNSGHHVFIVRDFTFEKALIGKKAHEAREVLRELDKSVGQFMARAEKSTDYLVLVTGSASKRVDFPAEGKEWMEFEKKGDHLTTGKPRLLGTAFAVGARAENMCGFYEEANLLERVLSGPKQQGLELRIINPFN